MKEEIKLALSHAGLTEKNAVLVPDTGRSLELDFEVSPEEFLDAAEFAYERGESGYGDAVGNAQRAIRCQVDAVVAMLGFDLRKMKIKRKIELFHEIGLLAPRLLNRVSEPRNLLEHAYRRPTQVQVGEALDIAALFIEATSRTMHNFWGSFDLARSEQKQNDEQQGLFGAARVHFLEDERAFRLWVGDPQGVTKQWSIDHNSDLFVPLLRIAVSISRSQTTFSEKRMEQAVTKFFLVLND
jgi:hypothetical protein